MPPSSSSWFLPTIPQQRQHPSSCSRRRRRHHHLHHRMPTWGKHRGSVAGSPLHATLTSFATAHGMRQCYPLDNCMSPAGLQPVASGLIAHLQRVYDELLLEDCRRRAISLQTQDEGNEKEKESRRKLSRAGLEGFLRDVQKDSKMASWSLSNAEGFTFEEFVQLWWGEYSNAKKRIYPEDKDLDKPLSNYFISSSHNTYIEDGNQITGGAKALQYKKVLESGCRCVEIDVWNGTEADEDAPNRTSRSSARTRSPHETHKQHQHWSLSSMLSWMKRETRNAARSMSFPATQKGRLSPKKSEASFRARAPCRARAISNLLEENDDSASRRASLLAREPRVCHAYESPAGDVTLHEAIPFRTVCATIRESAFPPDNDLPVIISLELHANASQQEKMVQIMKEEWGSLLLDEPLPGYDPLTTQPPLRELRRKILIKVKTGSVDAAAGAPSMPRLDSKSTLLSSSKPSSDCGSSQHHDGSGAPSLKPKRTMASLSTSLSSSASCKKPTAIDALRRLAIYTYSPGSFESFKRADSTAPAHIYSFGEEHLKTLHRTEHNQVFRHNRSFLARTFPQGLRSFLSSNPNYPSLFWRKGVQMVALNWQVWDTAMEINDAMFDREQGWVLKPAGYRSGDVKGAAGPDCQADVAGKKRMDLTITVLAGQHIPTPGAAARETGRTATRLQMSDAHAGDFRPRVTCFLHVESAAERDPKKVISKDEIAQRTRTASTEQPDWASGGGKLKFSTVRHVVEELSFVRFRVDHHGRGWPAQRTAWACIRLDRLQEGYRLIKLKDDDGYPCDGMLLVKIEKKVEDEPPSRPSVKVRTWNVCKNGASHLKSRWSCI